MGQRYFFPGSAIHLKSQILPDHSGECISRLNSGFSPFFLCRQKAESASARSRSQSKSASADHESRLRSGRPFAVRVHDVLAWLMRPNYYLLEMPRWGRRFRIAFDRACGLLLKE
jgi:hypothetical protein